MTNLKKAYIRSKFLHYVLPSVAAMWVYTIYTMVDGIFVARGVGETALAAVNLSMPIVNVAFACGILFAVAASTRASVCKGRGDTKSADRVFTSGVIAIAAVGITAACGIMLCLDKIAIFLGATEETIEYVKSYLGIIVMFLPFYMTAYNLEVLVKADGFPKLAIKTSCAAALCNIVLDAVFVLVFHWGVAGAAIATGLSQVLQFSVYFRHFLSKKTGFSFVKIAFADLKDAFLRTRMGIADCMTELSVAICIFIFNKVLLALSGSNGIVIYTVISYFAQLVLMTMMGINQGTQPLVSYYYGKEKPAFCRYIFRLALCCAGACSLFAFAIGMLCPNPIVAIYIDSLSNPALFEAGVRAFRLYSPAFLPLGAVITLMGYFTSLELPKPAMSISIGRGVIFTSIFVLAFGFLFGETGVWTAAAASETCSLLLALMFYRRKIRS